jgi:hypothetical protein
MKNVIKISALLILFLSTTSCFFDGVKGNGNVVVKNRSISSDFVRIKASGGIDVYLTENGETSLVVEADENLHDLIKTEVKNGTLYIGSKKSIWSARAKKVHVSIEKLIELEVTSGAEVTTENTLHADDLKIIATSGAEFNLHLKVNNLDCKSSSGSDVNIDGKANNFNVSSSSGSDIDAYGLETSKCIAKASSGSNIKVYVNKSFDGHASSGGNIHFKGNPEFVNSSDSSGGNIKKS